MANLKLPELRAFTRKYQHYLGLDDWQIEVNWIRKADNCDPDTVGECNWEIETHRAWLRVAKQDPAGEQLHTALHELIHLRLEGWQDKPFKYNSHYELGINRLADALLAAPGVLE